MKHMKAPPPCQGIVITQRIVKHQCLSLLSLCCVLTSPNKVKRKERPRVPEDILTLRTMCEVAAASMSPLADLTGVSTSLYPCFVCGRGGLADAVDMSGSTLARCSLCLLTMHTECGKQLQPLLQSESGDNLMSQTLRTIVLPDVFKAPVAGRRATRIV
jgi:hypothetical protein